MRDRPKLAAIAVAMSILWVVVYWATPAPDRATGDDLTITFGDPPMEPLGATDEDIASPVVRESTRPDPRSVEEAMARVIPPEFEKYVVEYGDNAHSISRKLYGTTAHWQAILKSNALTDPSRFREGQTIRVPVDPENVQGLPVDAQGEAIVRDDSGARREREVERSEYIVSKGDTLSGIANSIYGRASLWRLIRDANREQVNADGTNIRPGMVLAIPPPPAGE